MNRLTAGTLAAMTAMLLMAHAGAQTRSGADAMFEAARQKETLEGNLTGAIKEYGAILAKYKGDRGITAMALVRMAECYQKMGDSKSRKVYEQIVREYPDQKDAVAMARTHLGGARSSGALAKRLLCAECGDSEADLSPDGRLMVFTDWDSGDIAVRDMSTGQVKRLMAKIGTWKDSNDAYGEAPAFSPDLRQIVYFWETGNKGDDHQLRVMPNEPGGKSRVLINRPGGDTYYEPEAWFPDGKSVLVFQYQKSDHTGQFARVSVSDGAVKVLKSLEWRFYRIQSRPKLSPDGQYIAYSARAANPTKFPPAATDPKDQHIYVLAADGSTETEIVKTSGINRSPVWTPDGKRILFTSDRSGKFDLWAVAVQNGKAAGAAVLVSPEIGNVDVVGAQGGSYYYTNSGASAEYVNIAEFAHSGNNQSRIAHATEAFIGVRPAWSPDGKSIAFKRHHPGSANESNEFDVVVHSLETGDERTYLTNLGTAGGLGPANWSRDGKSLTTGVFSRGGPGLVYRIDLATGDFQLTPIPNLPSASSSDEKTVYLARNEEKDWDKLPSHIRAMDLSSGQEKEFFTMPEPGYSWFGLTPDGRTFIIRRQDPKTRTVRFARLNVDGTGYREIYAIAQSDFRDNFALTNDGRWILLAKRDENKNWQFIRIPIEGGAPEATGVALEASLTDRSIAFSPDGSRIAYTTVKRAEELWTLDNILSVLK
jgi:Tol biopolymer transport system component